MYIFILAFFGGVGEAGCSAAVAEAPELETSAATHARGRDLRDGPQPPESYERRGNAANTTLAGVR